MGWAVGVAEIGEQARGRRRHGGVGQSEGEQIGADGGLELGGGAFGGDAAVVDHGDALGESVSFLEVLGGEQHGGAGGAQLVDARP